MKCHEKDAYSTKARARQAAANARKSRGIILYTYRCPNCRRWHNTKQSQLLVGLQANSRRSA